VLNTCYPFSLLVLTVRVVAFLSLCCFPAPRTRAAISPSNIEGRWEFAITSGDTAAQLNSMGQATISTYLLQSGAEITNISNLTTDNIACDFIGNGNITVSTGTIDLQGNVTITFSVTLPDQSSFQYAFTGALNAGTPTTITGTYQRSAGGCTQGSLGTSSGPDGNFAATYFPDLSGTWNGAFDPVTGVGQAAVPATFTLTTNSDKSLSGTVTASTLTALDGITACFSGPITLQALPEGVSRQWGIGLQLFGMDANGTRLMVIGWATNPDGSTAAVGEDDPADGSNGTVNDGSNNAYTAYYGISGGPCDGLGGGDAPFLLVTHKQPKRTSHHHERKFDKDRRR
jgi:hypothetical protein